MLGYTTPALHWYAPASKFELAIKFDPNLLLRRNLFQFDYLQSVTANSILFFLNLPFSTINSRILYAILIDNIS